MLVRVDCGQSSEDDASCFTYDSMLPVKQMWKNHTRQRRLSHIFHVTVIQVSAAHPRLTPTKKIKTLPQCAGRTSWTYVLRRDR